MRSPLLSWTPYWIPAVGVGTGLSASRGGGIAAPVPLGNAGECSPGAPQSRRYFRCGRLTSRPSFLSER